MLRSNTIQRTITLLILLSVVPVLPSPIAGASERYVAKVSQLSGTVSIQRGTDTLAAAQDGGIAKEDILNTGADGSIGIIFSDETTISLGPGSKLIIQEYAFDTDHSQFSLVVRLVKGTAAYVSGLISKISPDAARFITPSASIGIRGTKFVVEVDPI